MPYNSIHQNSKPFPSSSTYAQQIDARYAAFEGKRSILQQKKNALEYEQKRIEAEEKKLDAAKRKVEFQKNRLEAERAREEMRLFEDVFERALTSMLRIANEYLDREEREKVLSRIEARVGCAMRDGGKNLGTKRVKLDSRSQCCASVEKPAAKVDIPVVNIEQKVEVPPVIKVEQKVEVTIPQKRSAACAGFRQAYVESEDDAEDGY